MLYGEVPPEIATVAVPVFSLKQRASVNTSSNSIESGVDICIFQIALHPEASTTTKSYTPVGNCSCVFG